MPLKMQVYPDEVCPLGHLTGFRLRPAIRGRDVEVEWMPFELRPEPSPTLRSEGESLQQTWPRSVYPMAERMGVPIVLPDIAPQPHTHPAFEGDQFATGRGLGLVDNERVLDAFLREGRDIGDAAGLPGGPPVRTPPRLRRGEDRGRPRIRDRGADTRRRAGRCAARRGHRGCSEPSLTSIPR